MHFRSLPNYFRGEKSPMIQTDSPFPPLKVEHRYRGVYERAGFDVNLGGYSHSEQGSMRLPKEAPNSRTFNSHRVVSDSAPGTYKSRNVSSRSMPQSASSPITDVSNVNRNRYAPARKSPFSPVSATGKKSTAPYPTSSNENLKSHEPYNHSYEGNISLPALVSGQPVASMESETHNDSTDYNSQSRNVKKLQLHIPYSNYSNVPHEQSNESSSSTNSQTFENMIEKPSTPNTSASSTNGLDEKMEHSSAMSVGTAELPHLASLNHSKDLSMDLNNFVDDRDHQKGYDPRRDASKNQKRPTESNHTQFIPDTGDLLRNLTKLMIDDTTDNTLENTSFQFTSAPYNTVLEASSAHDESNEQSEYQSFLLTSNHEPMLRYSQLSTVSSIISKTTGSIEGEEEVDPELQRQLDGFKNRSSVFKPRQESLDGSASYRTANTSAVEIGELPVVPKIQVHDTSESLASSDEQSISAETTQVQTYGGDNIPSELVRNTTDRSSVDFSEKRTSQGSTLEEPLQYKLSHTYEDSDFPLNESTELHDDFNSFEADGVHEQDQASSPFITERNPARKLQSSYPETPKVHASPFEETFNTPETIKPLSPKNHRVEEELKNMNFKYDVETPKLHNGITENVFDTSVDLSTDIDDLRDEVILLQNVPPEEFEAFPKSVMNMKVPNFRASASGTVYASGTGPCRVCGDEVDVNGRGSRKPIYSRNGELSGQWHRGCFSCTYGGCQVVFSKHIACYALLDNAFCKHHYHLLNGTLCETCGQGIEGECIENELKQKWHVSCLKCSKCEKSISSDYFLIANEIVCELDAPTIIAGLEQSGLLTSEKIEKRRTRMLFLEQQQGM